MKKIIFCVLLLAGVYATGFAEHETWFSAGFAFGNYFKNGDGMEKSYIGSPGVNLSFYSIFRQKNIGMFLNWGILFPAVNKMEDGFKPLDQFDFILAGVASAYTISEELKLYYGIGPSINFLIFSSKDHDTKAGGFLTGLGIGGDIGIKYNLPGIFCINIGTTLTWQFAGHSDMGDSEIWHPKERHGWVKNYWMIGIKPYIGVGIHF